MPNSLLLKEILYFPQKENLKVHNTNERERI